MFKKRIVNITKPIVTSQVNDQTDKTVEKEVQEQKNNERIDFVESKDIQSSNKMKQKKDEDEDGQFLQRLKRDKKLNDLFANLQAKEKDIQTSQNQNKSFGEDKQNQPITKPVKFVPYMKKKINFTFTQVDNTQKDKASDKKIQKPLITQRKTNVQKKQPDTEIEDIFRQIGQQNKKQQENELSKLQKEKGSKQQVIDLSIPTVKANQFIIQDEDEYVEQIPKQQFAYPTISVQEHGRLKVAVDYEGSLSPQLSQHEQDKQDFHQDDFEDQLIRKTLTRNNYLKLQQKSNLKQTKVSQKKEKLFNTILKTSWNDIEVKLSSDIHQKVIKKNQLVQEMKYLQERITQRTSQFAKKKQVLTELQTEQKKLKKIIYFLCYFGDKVCGKNESIDTFFNDLTPNIMEKILKFCEIINIEEFMQKKRNHEQLREQYHQGRKKIKGNEKIEAEQQINEEQNQEDEDYQFFMDDEDF